MLRKFKQQQKAIPARWLSFFCTFFRFCLQNNKEGKIKKFKVLKNTNIFSHEISNSKRARTKFKLTGKSKILTKFKQQMMFA